MVIDFDIVTGLWYTHVLSLGSRYWFWRYKEHPCPVSPDLELWRTLEVPDWGLASWYWFWYGTPIFWIVKAQSKLELRLSRIKLSTGTTPHPQRHRIGLQKYKLRLAELFLSFFIVYRTEAGASKTSDNIQIKIRMSNPSQEPPAPTKAPNQDLKDMDVLCTFKIKIENWNLDYGCIKDQWPYPNKDQDAKPQ